RHPHHTTLFPYTTLFRSAAEKMGTEPDAQGRTNVPESPKILHATRMVEPGQQAKLSFTASEETGNYQYVCTFPGHWRRMVGTLRSEEHTSELQSRRDLVC